MNLGGDGGDGGNGGDGGHAAAHGGCGPGRVRGPTHGGLSPRDPQQPWPGPGPHHRDQLHPSAISMATRCARRIAMATGWATHPRHGDCRHWRPITMEIPPSCSPNPLRAPLSLSMAQGADKPQSHPGCGMGVPNTPKDGRPQSTPGWG